MDSFYDAPRRPPIPTTVNRTEKTPIVPEISMVENSLFTQPKCFTRFDQRPLMRPSSEKGRHVENSLIDNHNKKQVRFESPSIDSHSQVKPNQILMNKEKENISQPLKVVPDLKGKTFKQIYMANVPDRHLDLSVFEPPPKVSTKEVNKPYTPGPETNVLTKENEKINTRCDTHIYSAPSSTNVLQSLENMPYFNQREEKVTNETTGAVKVAEKCTEIARPSDEPTIKDLFKIIQQQNEQIMLLQRQVSNLKNSIRQPEACPLQYNNGPGHPFMKELTNSPTKKGMFSFDVKATSFEVSFRPQHGKFRKQNDFLEPKIQEITECEDSKNNEDISLHLEESLNLKDSYLSTVPSIQINMDEYHSSDEDTESESPGITFYKNLMDQVNNVLTKMQAQSDCQTMNSKRKNNNVSGQTMKAVKQATLQHLKTIGVNLSPIQEMNEISGERDSENKDYDSTEVSFAVKQLLMKYLPDDKLTQALKKPKDQCAMKPKSKVGNTDFSYAAIQYMKKYNIINSKKFPEIEEKKINQEAKDPPKILDVTALKLQPKLL